MKDFQDLIYRFVPAQERREATPTLLLLHGTGGDENDLLPLGQEFGPGVNLLSLRGNVMENGMPRFFRRLGMGVFDEDDVQFRTHEIVHFLAQKIKELGLENSPLVALGYSNGANIAGAMLMLYPDVLAGAILWRPMQPLQQPPGNRPSRPVPVLMHSGSYDGTVQLPAIKHYENWLAGQGFAVQHTLLPTGHQLTQADVQQSLAWFAKHFNNK